MKEIDLNTEELEEIRSLLSKESYTNIKNEIKRLEEEPPSLKGSGVYNHQYNPVNEEELKQQNRIFRDRLDWLRTRHILKEIQNQFLMRENRKFDKEDRELREENQELRNELKRAHSQLHSLMGIKKTGRKNDNDSGESGKCEPELTAKKKRGAPIGHIGRTRPIPEKVDEVKEILPPDTCPHCGNSHIIIGSNYVSKYIEDIVPIVKRTVEKRYLKGRCSCCEHSVIAAEALEGPPVSIGPNLITLLTIMRERMGVAYRKLSAFSSETLQIPLSPTGVMDIINRVCTKFEPIYRGIEIALRMQSVLFADETGWRMDGARWNLWCFCNRFLVYFHPDASRGSKVPKAILGVDYSGIVHADFYAAYNFLSRLQRCLVHLQGDIKDELEIVPDDNSLIQLKSGFKEIIEKGTEVKSLPTSEQKNIKRKQLDDILQRLTQLTSDNKKTKNLIKRIIRHQDDLLRFIDNPDVEFSNNRAERMIRLFVLARKVSFGNRTPQGALNYAVLVSVIETCRLRKKNLTQFIQHVYHANNKEIKRITRELLDTS
jgi:transposase